MTTATTKPGDGTVTPPLGDVVLSTSPTEDKYAPLPKSARHGIGLCLSGGGFRATLFHLGALRRLNELCILSFPDFRTVTSVSAGSIPAAALATAITRVHVHHEAPIAKDY